MMKGYLILAQLGEVMQAHREIVKESVDSMNEVVSFLRSNLLETVHYVKHQGCM